MIITLSLSGLYVCGQDIKISHNPFNLDPSCINQVDSLGRKQGLWFDIGYKSLAILHYEDDKETGLARYYDQEGDTDVYNLYVLGNFNQGKPSGEWQYFHDNGVPGVIQTRIQPNVRFLEEARWAGYEHPEESSQCYIQIYDNCGKLEREGWAIFIEDFEYEGENVGEWKIYSPQGCTIKDHSKILKQRYDRMMQD